MTEAVSRWYISSNYSMKKFALKNRVMYIFK